MKIDNLFKGVDKDFELELGFTQVDILDFRGKEPDLEFIEERKREDVVKMAENAGFEFNSQECYYMLPQISHNLPILRIGQNGEVLANKKVIFAVRQVPKTNQCSLSIDESIVSDMFLVKYNCIDETFFTRYAQRITRLFKLAQIKTVGLSVPTWG